MRAIFPKDVWTPRAFRNRLVLQPRLPLLRNSYRLRPRPKFAAPGPMLKKKDPQGRIHSNHLRDAPIIMAKPDGLLQRSKGLNVEVIKTARLGGDPRTRPSTRNTTRAHMASPMPLGDHAGGRLEMRSLHHAGGREHQRPGHHAARDQAQGQARSEIWKGMNSPCRSTIR